MSIARDVIQKATDCYYPAAPPQKTEDEIFLHTLLHQLHPTSHCYAILHSVIVYSLYKPSWNKDGNSVICQTVITTVRRKEMIFLNFPGCLFTSFLSDRLLPKEKDFTNNVERNHPTLKCNTRKELHLSESRALLYPVQRPPILKMCYNKLRSCFSV